MSKYPCIDSFDSLKGKDHECAGCDRPAAHYVRVEFSYMNGEDEVYHVCQKHLQIARENLKRFFAHCTSKEKYIKSKGAA